MMNRIFVSFAVLLLGATLAFGQAAQPVAPVVGGAVVSTGNPFPVTISGALVSSTIIPNNTTAIPVKGSAGQIYAIECFNNSATIAYIKIYDATSATAGSGTPADRKMCPSSTSGAGFVISYPNGRQFSTGITYVVTTGIADADTTAPAANTYIVNVGYK